jgi:hypothetical protein
LATSILVRKEAKEPGRRLPVGRVLMFQTVFNIVDMPLRWGYFCCMDVTHFSDGDLDLMNKIIGFDGDRSATIKVRRSFRQLALGIGSTDTTAKRNATIIRQESMASILEQAEYIELVYKTQHTIGGNRDVQLKAKGVSAFAAGGFHAVQRNQLWEKRKKNLAFWFSVVALVVSLLTFFGKAPSVFSEWKNILKGSTTSDSTQTSKMPEAPLPVEPAVVYERVVGQSKNETRSSGDSAIADE